MKKSRLQSIKDSRADHPPDADAGPGQREEIKVKIDWQKIKNLRKMPKEKKDEWMDNKAAKVRAHYMSSRWEIFAPDPDSPNGIDMNNPNVRLEWLLQDPRIIFRLVNRSSKLRKAGLEMLPEDLRPLYLYGTDPAGKKYTDIQPPKMTSAIRRQRGKFNESDFQEIDDETFAAYMDGLSEDEIRAFMDDELSDQPGAEPKD